MKAERLHPKRLGRFELRQLLGSGAFGSVFEAWDPEHEATLALKRLDRADARSLDRFKREFRSLAAIVHPHVLRLHELFAEEDDFYFTMELVRGTDFVSHVRGELGPAARTGDVSTVVEARPDARASRADRSSTGAPELDWKRLSQAAAGLVRGVAHIHRAGLLHRDLKPSNVLVESVGSRVVVVDFGIALDKKARALDEDLEITGTPAYMAPEQASGEPVLASDWYAVGVMLFEAVAGRRPFFGNDRRVLREKLHIPAPRLSELAPGVPAGFDDLVGALLERAPEIRPLATDILARLGASDEAPEVAPADDTPFVGRVEALEALHQAALEARRGGGRNLIVSGESGIGKTTLLERLASLAHADGLTVLQGRCYENETIAYKGFDGVIDALVRELTARPGLDLPALRETGMAALARIFPALRRIDTVRDVELPHADVLDRHELRRRAFLALRALLAELAPERGLLVIIDDVQWSDADSVALISAIAAPPPHGMCFVVSHRSEESGNETLRALERALLPAPQRVELEPLSDAEAEALLARRLDAKRAAELAHALGHEARGNPFLLEQLAHAFDAAGPEPSQAGLERAVSRRLERMPPAAGRILELASVAAKPLDRRVLLAAADVPPAPGLSLVHALLGEQLLRKTASARDAFDVYHDRIRQVVSSTLTPDALLERHVALADTLAAQDDPDHDALYFHAKHAGRRADAARHAELAAASAAAALAFDRAASLYREALALGEHAPEHRRELDERLAEALVYSGRGVEAADVYLALADESSGTAELDLRRRATEQLLVCGAVPRALTIATAVLVAVGLRIARARFWAVVETLWLRFRLRLRGLHWAIRSESELAPLDLIRIDICETLAGGLGFNDTLRGAPFSARYTLLSIEVGEPRRLARALALEGAYSAALGDHERGRKLHAQGREVAVLSGRPDALAPVVGLQALAATLRGDFREALTDFDESFRLYHEEGGMSATTSHFEISMLRQYRLNALYHLGELRELADELPEALASAKDRGNIGFGTSLRLADTSMLWLVQDRPDDLRREATEALSHWPERPFTLIQCLALLTFAALDIYEGNARAAAQRFSRSWRSLTTSLVLRVQRTRGLALLGRARAAVSAAHAGIEAARNLRLARRCLGRLRKIDDPWLVALAYLLEGCIRHSAGDDSGARSSLEIAERDLARQDLRLYHAVACLALSKLSAGVNATGLAEQARSYFADQGVVRPERVVAVLAPSFEGQ